MNCVCVYLCVCVCMCVYVCVCVCVCVCMSVQSRKDPGMFASKTASTRTTPAASKTLTESGKLGRLELEGIILQEEQGSTTHSTQHGEEALEEGVGQEQG